MSKYNAVVHENGNFWVARSKCLYTVFCAGLTHSKSDSSYEGTPSGLSIAIARCDYLANRSAKGAAK